MGVDARLADEDRESSSPPHPARRLPPRRLVSLVVVAAVVVAVAVVAGTWTRDSSELGGEVGILALPAPGEVVPAFVGNDPVYVVRDGDGHVHVLSAVSPHDPRGMRKVVAWCRSSGLFEDLWHGSKFQPDGTYVDGPAPTGLVAYRSTVVSDTVVVGPPHAAPARPGPDDPAGPEPTTPSCDERTQMGGIADRAVLDDLLLHPGPAGDDGLVYPDEQSVLGVPVATPT